jgi:hypothetical protein
LGILKEQRCLGKWDSSEPFVEAGKGKNTGRYIIEIQRDELIKELNIDKNRIMGYPTSPLLVMSR